MSSHTNNITAAPQQAPETEQPKGGVTYKSQDDVVFSLPLIYLIDLVQTVQDYYTPIANSIKALTSGESALINQKDAINFPQAPQGASRTQVDNVIAADKQAANNQAVLQLAYTNAANLVSMLRGYANGAVQFFSQDANQAGTYLSTLDTIIAAFQLMSPAKRT